MLTIRHNRVVFIELLLATLALTGVSLTNILPSVTLKVLATILVWLGFVSFIFVRDRHVRSFEPSSKRLDKFFCDWYSQPGRLIVYCNDLEWITSNEVQNALTLKATNKNLILYLKDIGLLANHLKALNAKLYQIPPASNSAHKFSILMTEDLERIICRNKMIEPVDAAGELVQFVDTNSVRDPYLVALAKDVLTGCNELP